MASITRGKQKRVERDEKMKSGKTAWGREGEIKLFFVLYLPQTLPESIHLLAPPAGDNSTYARAAESVACTAAFRSRARSRRRRAEWSQSKKKKKGGSESSFRGDGCRRRRRRRRRRPNPNVQMFWANGREWRRPGFVATREGKKTQAPNAKLQFLLHVSAAGFRVTHTGNSYPVFITFESKHAGDFVRSFSVLPWDASKTPPSVTARADVLVETTLRPMLLFLPKNKHHMCETSSSQLSPDAQFFPSS